MEGGGGLVTKQQPQLVVLFNLYCGTRTTIRRGSMNGKYQDSDILTLGSKKKSNNNDKWEKNDCCRQWRLRRRQWTLTIRVRTSCSKGLVKTVQENK